MKILITSPLAFNQEEMLRTEPASSGLPSLTLPLLDVLVSSSVWTLLVFIWLSSVWTPTDFKYFLIKAKFSDVRLAVTRGLTLKHLG
jgi:hypothetical protein